MPAITLEQAYASARRISILLFGPPFSGKTEGLATLWDVLPTLGYPQVVDFFDLDLNADSFLRKMRAKNAPPDAVRVYRYGATGDKVGEGIESPLNRGEFGTFLQDWNRLWDRIDPATGGWLDLKDGWRPPGLVVFDSASSLQAMIIEYVCAIEGKPLNAPGTHGAAFYGKQMGKVVELIGSAKKLPVVFAMTAHEVMEKDEITGAVRIDPKFTGKLAADIAKYFTVCLYTTTEGVEPKKYVWLTKPHGFVQTSGTRYKEGNELPLKVEQDFRLVL